MEKRKAARRRTGELKSAARGVVSDAESTVSTRSSNSSKSNSSSASRKQRHPRAKAEQRGEVDGGEDAGGQLEPLESRLGAMLETTEAQMGMILLIALDVGCTALETHLHDQQQLASALQQLESSGTANVVVEVAASLVVRVATRLAESFTGFTLVLFWIELAVLLAALRQQFFAHSGYVLDLAIVSVSLAVELYAQTKAMRLLGILRLWRVLRLVRRLVEQERSAHDVTRRVLEQEQVKLLHVRMQKDAAHESLKREYESRAGLEQLLRSYKDEVVTLKEALQIAAQAVAESAMSESSPVGQEMYQLAEDATAGSAFAAYPVDSESAYAEEYYHQEVAAVHPSEMAADVETTQYWQEGEESEHSHQEAAAVYPVELQEGDEQRQDHSGDNHIQEAAAMATNELQQGVRPESENEFEDAVDE